jgi:threonine/homoserine/homoserine lactone efflux protein
MIAPLLLKGCLIGFSIAMPVGPIGLLCIRNSLTYGLMCGLFTGLGAACADAFYGALAGLGIAAISEFFAHYRTILQLVGSLFLCYLGLRTFYETPRKSSQASANPHSQVFLTTFFLTLTNPMTILSFAAIYAGLGVGSSDGTWKHTLAITSGVFLGSAAWWLILSFFSSLFKEKISATVSLGLNRISGAILFGFGIALLIPS